MIDILSLKEKTQSQVIDLILDEGTQPIGILVPKITDSNSDRDDVAIEYGNLAYYGQMLFDISTDFSYQQVAPEEDGPFKFMVTTPQISELADVLLEICVAVSSDPDEDFPDIDDLVPFMLRDLFLEDVQAKELKPACKYFCTMYLEYNKRKRKQKK